MKAAAHAAAAGQAGWSEAQKQMDSTSSYAQTFKPDEKAGIIKFLEDEPYANFKRHWIKRSDQRRADAPGPTPACARSGDGKPKDCPLCKIGEKPQAVSCFNIAICAEDGTLAVKSWDMGAKVYNLAEGVRQRPQASAR